MTDEQRETAAAIVRGVGWLVAAFVVLSMVGQFALVWTGRIPAGESAWRPVFDLVTLLVGIVAGYVSRDAQGRPPDDDDGTSRVG